MIKIKPIKVKPMKLHLPLDTDNDKVPDYKDCRPFNPRKQHLVNIKKEDKQKVIKHVEKYYPDVKEAMHKMDFVLIDEYPKDYKSYAFGIVPRGSRYKNKPLIHDEKLISSYSGEIIDYGEKEGIEEIPQKPGRVYRGMSHQEYINAKKKGCFRSRGGYNIGDAQVGKTFGTTEAQTGQIYASGFQPFSKTGTPDKPSKVVVFKKTKEWKQAPDTGSQTERAREDVIPFSEVEEVYEQDFEKWEPGYFELQETWGGELTQGARCSPKVREKWKPIYAKDKNYDIDNDGVPDQDDCRPLNPRLQHIRPSRATRERLEQLPIYVTDERMEKVSTSVIPEDPREDIPWEDPRTYHILSKEAKKKAPKARTNVLSMIKKYPGIVGEIEKSKPKRYYHCSYPEGTSGGSYDVWAESVLIHTPEQLPWTKKEVRKMQYDEERWPESEIGSIASPEIREEITQVRLNLWPYEEESKRTQRRKTRRRLASSTYHELRHKQQYEGSDIDKKRELSNQFVLNDYYSAPIEVDARAYAKQEMDKYRKRKPTGEEITKWLELE